MVVVDSSTVSSQDEQQNEDNNYHSALDELFEKLVLNKRIMNHDDKDNENDRIDQEDIVSLLTEAAARSGRKVDPNVLRASVQYLMAEVSVQDGANLGQRWRHHGMTRDQFVKVFERTPDAHRCVVDDAKPKHPESTHTRARVSLSDGDAAWNIWPRPERGARKKNRSRLVVTTWVVVYLSAISFIFVRSAWRWTHTYKATALFGYSIVSARASAAVLNFNAAVVLLPVCKHFVTILSRTRLRFAFLPSDVVLHAHILVGFVIAAFTASHVLSHCVNFYRFVQADASLVVSLFGDKLGPIPESKTERLVLLLTSRVGVTGILMLLCMIAAYSSIPHRRQAFNCFWFTHHLLVVMLFLLCVHGTQNLLSPQESTKWVAGPLALYLIPKLYRQFTCGKSPEVLSANIRGDVLDIKIRKPKNYDWIWRAGMYAYINIPEVSRLEWHPFTMTSCPAQEYLQFHIQVVGDWTREVLDLMRDRMATGLEEGKGGKAAYPVIRVDGPIGAPAQHFKDYPVVVLIAAGMGVTRMVSVLRDIMYCHGRVRRAFLYWTARDQNLFALFSGLMEEVYEQDCAGGIEIFHFLTSAKQSDRCDVGSILLNHTAYAIHSQMSFDILLGHHSHKQVHIGRPRWEKELSRVVRVADELGETECGVFLCGPVKMADEVRRNCAKLSERNKVSLFFAKETF